MVLLWWLKEVSRVITPGTSRICLNPIVLIATACLGSVALLQAQPVYLLTALVTLTASAAVIRGVREVLSAYVLLLPFILLYSVSALIIQLVLGAVDPHAIFINSCRIASIALLALTLMSMLSISEFISYVGRFFPKTALSIALTIKLLEVTATTLVKLNEVYSVNLSCACSGIRGKLLLTKALARAVTYLSIVNALEVSEALYTRYSVIIKGLRSWR